jgi:inosine/xanthosine triphosphatase
MKKIIVASRNPVKIQAARSGFQRMFPGEAFSLESASVPSGVSHQPLTDRETLQGAMQRTENAARLQPAADFWVGIEGGVEEQDGELGAFAWVVVRSPDRVGKSRTGTFYLPPAVAAHVRAGKELGEADDLVFQRSNSKQENGAIGLLTGDVVDRAALYEQAVILALAPFRIQTCIRIGPMLSAIPPT